LVPSFLSILFKGFITPTATVGVGSETSDTFSSFSFSPSMFSPLQRLVPMIVIS